MRAEHRALPTSLAIVAAAPAASSSRAARGSRAAVPRSAGGSSARPTCSRGSRRRCPRLIAPRASATSRATASPPSRSATRSAASCRRSESSTSTATSSRRSRRRARSPSCRRSSGSRATTTRWRRTRTTARARQLDPAAARGRPPRHLRRGAIEGAHFPARFGALGDAAALPLFHQGARVAGAAEAALVRELESEIAALNAVHASLSPVLVLQSRAQSSRAPTPPTQHPRARREARSPPPHTARRPPPGRRARATRRRRRGSTLLPCKGSARRERGGGREGGGARAARRSAPPPLLDAHPRRTSTSGHCARATAGGDEAQHTTVEDTNCFVVRTGCLAARVRPRREHANLRKLEASLGEEPR